MKTRHRKGIVLIVVVFLLPLIGVGTVLLTRQTAQLVVATRQMQQDTELTNIYLSVCAYLQANRQTLVRPDAPLTQILPMEGIAAKSTTASIQIDPSGPSDRTIVLTVQLQKKSKPIQRKWIIRLTDRHLE